MSETITCPHCKSTYTFLSYQPPADDFMATCQRCQRTFRMIYGRRPELAADAAAGRPVSTFRCPHCSTNTPPVTTEHISPAGWMVFAVLLLFFLPLCWVGLLIKQKSTLCSSCGVKLG